MKHRWSMVALITIVSLLTGGWLLRDVQQRAGLQGPQLLQTVLQYMQRYYVDSLAADSVYADAAAGAVKELHDPYSALEQDEDYRNLNEITSGNYGGLGIQIEVRAGLITVVAPLPQTPAERAGIEAGDQIVDVNGKSVEGFTQDQAVKTLRGEVGTPAALKVRRPGMSQLLSFTLVREKIHNRSVQPGTMLDDRVGLVRLTTISDSSGVELRNEINGLLKQGMKGLILDLRQNPGGLLTQGVSVSDMFLDGGRKIVETRGRMADMNHQYTDETPQLWPTLPVVVLVDAFTASAAEIVAGALQDNDRAVIVGSPTFGKGLVQTLWSFGNGKGLKLTTGRWYTPSGRTIQRTASSAEDQLRLANAEGERTGNKWLDSLPSYRTISGRTVKGGGGIVPDRLVRPDTFTAAERDLIKSIGDSVPGFRDALVSEALHAKEAHLVTSPDFTVTPAMRQALLDRLRTKHVTFTNVQLNAAGGWLDDQLAYEIERYVFGRAAELRRRSQADAQIREGIMLLRNGPTQSALMAQVAGGPGVR